jgi:hypothetical protein
VARGLIVSWRGLMATLIVVIFFIPIRRYTLPAKLSFQLEPYRLLVAFIVLGWIAALLIDRRVRLRGSGFEGPLGLIMVAIFVSIALNTGSIATAGVSSDVLKSVTFFASFLLIFYCLVSVVGRQRDIDMLVKVLVTCAAVVGVLSVYEWRTGSNVFNHLRTIFPFLQLNTVPNPKADITGFTRGGRLRVFASAEHPIALGAALLMVTPLSVYLALKTHRWYWWLAGALISLGALATVSRTGIIMLVVIVFVYLWLRPRQTLRFWPAIVPALLLVHFALPNTLGILKSSLFPSGGLKTLAVEQGSQAGSTSGRLAKVGPTLDEVSGDPLFGVGFGSQVLSSNTGNGNAVPPSFDALGRPIPRARILDDQWLGTLLETGFVGVIAWILLFGRFIRRLARAAKDDTSVRGWLLVGLTGSVAAFTVSMLFYDAFAFIQVVFVLFILLGLSAVLLRQEKGPDIQGFAAR